MEIELTKITSRGQVVIPKEIRVAKNIKKGERFLVYTSDDSLVLKRLKTLEKKKDIKEFESVFAKTWKIAKKRGLTRKVAEKEIEAYRREKRKR